MYSYPLFENQFLATFYSNLLWQILLLACLKLFNYLSNLVQKVSKKCSNLVRFDQSANCRKQFSLVFAFLCNAQMTISNGIFLVMLQWTTILKYGFCKKSFLFECTPDQLNTFSPLFGTVVIR